jgi:hypothetical protein
MSLVEYCVVRSSGLDQVWDEVHCDQVVASPSRGGTKDGCAESGRWYRDSCYADSVAGCIHSRIAVLEPCFVHSSGSAEGWLGGQGVRQTRRVAEIQQYSSTTHGRNVGASPQPDARIEKKENMFNYQRSFIFIATRKTRPVYLIWCRSQ